MNQRPGSVKGLIEMKDIPIHQLQGKLSSGFEIRRFFPGEVPSEVKSLGAHRDDHYLFFIIEDGSGSVMIDFNEVVLNKNSLYYILPGQVHHYLRNEQVGGWFVAVDTVLVASGYRNVFEGNLLLQQPFLLNNYELWQCVQLLTIIEEKYREDNHSAFYLPVIQSLMQSFLGLAATCFSQSYNPQSEVKRPAQLSHEFKKLLIQNVRTLKRPSAYAEKLNVSESYLNEALKKTTGCPVSYWITQEVILEAKRLLYYSDFNAKQIAHTLGYNDHTYFARLFKKATGVTVLSFRRHYRK